MLKFCLCLLASTLNMIRSNLTDGPCSLLATLSAMKSFRYWSIFQNLDHVPEEHQVDAASGEPQSLEHAGPSELPRRRSCVPSRTSATSSSTPRNSQAILHNGPLGHPLGHMNQDLTTTFHTDAANDEDARSSQIHLERLSIDGNRHLHSLRPVSRTQTAVSMNP